MKFDKNDINAIAGSAFEMILEDYEDFFNMSYEDLSSVRQKDYLTEVQKRLNHYFDNEFRSIEEHWSDKDTEIKRLENENRRLKQQLVDINKTW